MRSKLLSVLLIIPFFTSGQLWLPRIFGNGMILQRDMPVPVCGKAYPGDTIIIRFKGYKNRTIADLGGQWKVFLPSQPAGGPYQLDISENGKYPDLKKFINILLGDVWFASGQSNMELKVSEAANAKVEISQANYLDIRFFVVPHKMNFHTENEVSGGSWNNCDSLHVANYSAVAYYFARKIYSEKGIPVGVIQSTWGGSPVEAWTSREMLLSSAITRDRVLADDSITTRHFIRDSLNLIRFWDIVYHPQNETDKSIPLPDYNDKNWKTLQMPSVIRNWKIYPFEGIVWLRKSIVLQKKFLDNSISIHLGHPEMNYSLYVNGKELARTIWNAAKNHTYKLPAHLLHEGENVIALRMSVLWGGGGLNPPAKNIYLANEKDTVSLSGQWKYNEQLEPVVPKIKNYQYYPDFLYNCMVKPVIPYALKGFIWYQGEANDTLAYHYQTLFPMLINDWRIRWQQGYLPFLFVQLPNYRKQQPTPVESEWAELREAQSMALSLPETGMACTIDLGEVGSIHPLNKQEVGLRLALEALRKVYGESQVSSSPRFQQLKIKKNKIYLYINQSGMTTSDHQVPRGLSMAGSDKKFYWARAIINDNEIIVWSEKVAHPEAVRYDWADNPDGNIINSSGLPLVPFRTDKWKKLTQQ